MRKALYTGFIVLAVGVVLFVLGVMAGVAAGGVPYPDGPNAGHLSEPGFGRTLENICGPVMGLGVVIALLGGVVVIAAAVAMLVRRFTRK